MWACCWQDIFSSFHVCVLCAVCYVVCVCCVSATCGMFLSSQLSGSHNLGQVKLNLVAGREELAKSFVILFFKEKRLFSFERKTT